MGDAASDSQDETGTGMGEPTVNGGESAADSATTDPPASAEDATATTATEAADEQTASTEETQPNGGHTAPVEEHVSALPAPTDNGAKRLSRIQEENDVSASRVQEDDTLLDKRKSTYDDVAVHVEPVPDTKEDGEGGKPSCSDRLRGMFAWMKKNEFLILLIGSITFFLGCIFLAVGAYMMQAGGTCTQGLTPAPANGSASVGHSGGDLVDADDFVAYRGPPDSADRGNDTRFGNDTEATLPMNLAIGRPAYQSTTYSEDGHSYPADMAVDDSNQLNFAEGSCARTEEEAMPYWYVDLEALQLVRSVHIMLPADCCMAEMHNFEVRVGESMERLKKNLLCRYYMGTSLRSTVKIVCETPLYGRYVSIQMLGDETRPRNRLNLCEVKVYS